MTVSLTHREGVVATGRSTWVKDWAQHAVCSKVEPDALFVRGAAQQVAKQLCVGCPVIAECLADSLDNQTEFGVRGAMTERQRRALVNRRTGSCPGGRCSRPTACVSSATPLENAAPADPCICIHQTIVVTSTRCPPHEQGDVRAERLATKYHCSVIEAQAMLDDRPFRQRRLASTSGSALPFRQRFTSPPMSKAQMLR